MRIAPRSQSRGVGEQDIGGRRQHVRDNESCGSEHEADHIAVAKQPANGGKEAEKEDDVV